MRTTFQKEPSKHRYFDFGFKTKHHQCMYFISSGIEYFEYDKMGKRDVVYATLDFTFFKNPKFWFK